MCLGQYSDQLGATACQRCPAGLFVNGDGDATLHDSIDDCSGCDAGEIPLLSENGAVCAACPAGRYKPISGLAACIVCPSGYYNQDNGTSAHLHYNCSAPAVAFSGPTRVPATRRCTIGVRLLGAVGGSQLHQL